MGSYGMRDGVFAPKKLSVKGKMPVTFSIPMTVAYGTGTIVSNWNTHTATTAKTNTAFLEQPPYPMVLGVTANAAGTAAHADTIVFKGYNALGKYIQESVAVSGTAAGVFYTSNAFAKVTSVVPYPTLTPLPKSTSIAIGWRPLTIGLPFKIDSATDLLSFSYGSTRATTAPTVSKVYNTLTLATTAVAEAVNVMYMSRVQ